VIKREREDFAIRSSGDDDETREIDRNDTTVGDAYLLKPGAESELIEDFSPGAL